MIYVLGMSHAINVLRAAAAEPLALTHENWSEQGAGGGFSEVSTAPGLFPGQALRAFIVTPACGWGLMATLQSNPEGQATVVGVDGFVNLLVSVQEEQQNSVMFSFVHGNEHSMLSMVQHPRPYDFSVPWQPDAELERGFQPIPYNVVRNQVRQALTPTIACLAMMRIKLPQMRLVHVAPPPPVASTEQILHTPEVFRERLAQSGITPLSIRVKYYQTMLDVLRQELAPFNVHLLESPAAAQRPDGALQDQFAYAATHANQAYGALVLQQMRAIACSGR